MSFAKGILKDLEQKDLYRSLKDSIVAGERIILEGQDCLNFASNDYLGITKNTHWQEGFFKDISSEENFIMSSVASRLLAGNNIAFTKLENLIANSYKTEENQDLECLVFNSGYHANTGILPSLTSPKDLIIADKQVHASIIDSLSLSKAKWLRFKHNDYEDLIRLLEKNRADFENVFIVTESLFSMDADIADIAKLVEIKTKYNCFLYVDEAHSIGVFGNTGLGLCDELGLVENVDFIMATMGKALASEGAFLLCKKEFKELLINKCRSFIFTTAIAPINALWSEFVLKKLSSMQKERSKLEEFSKKLKDFIPNAEGQRHVISIIIGDSDKALRLQKALLNKDIYAPAIRYPSVAKNSARLRLSLSAAMEIGDINYFIDSYNECLKELE